ncbi:hypothetical protein Dalk_0823 [Desulfatibacillum aliphaticivorans]|uniref:DUF1425 domain-containing protein n=1 Tax=Desulfatibacillum aliphaticivorans TaxID=218208 RepID=B8FHW1_DESAL|nr:YcfL family protein [Desulfatibacillum aliphaticivorans]ACL02528.1 hypothetical protein Dalk_0823 [Desulfatibacillum aliphaticivorans]
MRTNARISFVIVWAAIVFTGLGPEFLFSAPLQNSPPIDESHPGIRLVIGGKDLTKQVRLVNPKIAPLGKLKKGMVQLRNVSDNRLTLEYKFDWMDEDGFLIGDGGIWERFSIGPGGVKTLQTVGKSPKAAQMQVTVRFPGDAFMDNRD